MFSPSTSAIKQGIPEAKPDCYGAQSPDERSGFGTCDPPSATRSASSEGGDNLGPDDPSKYLSIDEAKARALKELQEAKADALAAFAKWLKDNKKSYAADSELGKQVFALFVEIIETGITHNSDPEAMFAVGLTSELDRKVVFGFNTKGGGANRRSLQTDPGSPWGVLGPEPAAPKLEGFGMTTLLGAQTCSAPTLDTRNGLLTAQNQGMCGSCWAFAAAGAIQAQSFAAGQAKAPYLSTQQLVDCAVSSQLYAGMNNMGCNGGYTAVTLEYIKKEGLLLDTDYPYEMSNYRDGIDPVRKSCRSGLKVNKKRYFVPSYQRLASNENTMRDEMCMRGAKAIIIGIYVCDAFQNYKGGILTANCVSDGHNGHAITIVGYGTATVSGVSVPYWLVRNSWGANPTIGWGDPLFPGYIRIKRGVNLVGIANFPYRIATPYTSGGDNPLPKPPPPASVNFTSCYTSTAWRDGVFRAQKGTSWGNYWAVASTSACNQYGYSYNYVDKLTAEQSAVTACTTAFKVPCKVMRSGRAVCTDTTRIASLKTWIESRAATGQIYAVAINGTCGTGYGRWSNSDWTYVNGVTGDCKAQMVSAFGTTAANPCGIVLKGQKGTTTYRCTDATKWASTKALAIKFTWWGYAWSAFTDPGCGNRWYSYNWGTVEEARISAAALGGCNSAAAAIYGANSCTLVDSGVAKCTNSAAWASTVDLAKSKCSPGYAWAVWVDKTCTQKWYAWNFNTVDAALTSRYYGDCNAAAVAAGSSDYSCGAVAWGYK
ncbi:hypothetical protein HYH03_013365 [Edaphochlamys debaryana]|uniref:Peptidase C1A papain C-terminal domain-containing protein n=1 Tax=Edaphochlamys debaryana TaxID=47281 RepID=A0A835XTP4_9CHLO|nr:hypothetical protein HYH03_013365 [Edaphochlamys debaryana]|eukprot:KAG2488061.1 hypothetical protein HYH03_013365 [Edaphochlamys debaryana]